MLSILIPIYNYNVLPLVTVLHKQCVDAKINFEILCQDDASNSILNIENQKINSFENCIFKENTTNFAHRENRNNLAEKAKYDYLLFIDGDSNILKNNYIQNYIIYIKDFDVVYGGRLHPEKCPSDNQKLRWKYGRFIEDKSVENRKKKPFQSLLFNNTLIKKKCFDKIKFDKNIIKYGHDDTQLSFQLYLLNAKINHIENQVEHADIDTNKAYLLKTKEALENLFELNSDNKIDADFNNLIKLTSIFRKVKINIIISKIYLLFVKPIFKNLEGSNPKLWVFNIFRVGHLCSLKQ